MAAEAHDPLTEQRVAAIQAQLRQLYETVPFGAHAVDAAGHYEEINAIELAWLGCTREELLGLKGPLDFLSTDSAAKFSAHCLQSGMFGFAGLELDLIGVDGHVRPISVSVTRTRGLQGEVLPYRAVSMDLTETRQRAERQRLSARAFQALTGICVLNGSGRILEANAAFAQLTGYGIPALKLKSLGELGSNPAAAAFQQMLGEALRDTGRWQGEISNLRPDGTVYELWITLCQIPLEDDPEPLYACSCFDLTAQKAAQAEINRLAFFDPLTKLPNRRLLEDRLQHALSFSARHGLYGAVLFVDLDNFKTINDTRGHKTGDILLMEAANRLRRNVRDVDTVARFGGDEFVVLLTGLTANPHAVNHASFVAKKILGALAETYQFGAYQFHCTASIGVILFRGTEGVEELLQQADLAMYEAKKAGRGSLRFFSPTMQAQFNSHVSLEQDLRLAVVGRQLHLRYQPQVEHAGRVVGAEALLRWVHPARGNISPAVFIPLAEETNLILEIGYWVLSEACRQLKAWEADPLTRHLELAVNISSRQFFQREFVDQVITVVKGTGINPGLLKLELTESVVFDIEDTCAKIAALAALGIRFSLDDFGTGHSSLAQLTRLPIQQLKIDKSFVGNVGIRPADLLVVQLIVSMAKALGLEVIAEGVETEAQRAMLEANDCPLYQGFLCSPALVPDAFYALVAGRAIASAPPMAQNSAP